MTKFRPWAIAAAALVLVTNVTVSSMYYSFFDPTLNDLRRSFENRQFGEMSCDEPVRRTGGQIIEPAACDGGILERRDRYLKSKHVLGPAWYAGYIASDTRTRGIHIRYWF